MNRYNKITKIIFCIILITITLLFATACNSKKDKWFADGIKTTELKQVETVNNREDLTNLMDYSAFYSRRVKAKISESYKQKLKADFDLETRWAAQYADLAHNAERVLVYDENLDQGDIEVHSQMPIRYGFKTGNNGDVQKIYTLDYFKLTRLKKDKVKYQDLRLYKSNKGFIKVENSEQLFYATLNGYFPVWDKSNKVIKTIMEKCLEVLSVQHSKSEFERIRRTYLHMINEANYDFDTQKKKTKNDYREYAAYYLEGFFFHKQAVCDGLTKAYSLLLSLDGFEIYHVADVIKGVGGHAYNYVKVEGEYYLSSITNSIQTTRGERIRDYRYFLTDYKANDFDGYKFQSEEFPQIKEKLLKTKPINYHEKFSDIKLSLVTKKIKTEKISDIKMIIEYAKKMARVKKIKIEIPFQTTREVREQIAKKEDVEILCTGCENWACFV